MIKLPVSNNTTEYLVVFTNVVTVQSPRRTMQLLDYVKNIIVTADCASL